MRRILLSIALLIVAISTWGLVPRSADALCRGGTPDALHEPDQNEQCDDGNQANGDGCETDCTFTPGFTCNLSIPFEDLTTWAYPGTANSANWTPGRYSRTQTMNTRYPTFAFFGVNSMTVGNTVLELYVDQPNYGGGTGENGDRDDDYLGFVLGFNKNTATQASNQYLLIDWKAQKQDTGSNITPPGMRLSVVQGMPTLGSDQFGRDSDFWQKSDLRPASKIRILAAAAGQHTNDSQSGKTTYGETGWRNRVRYQFRFEYSATQLKVFVRVFNPSAGGYHVANGDFQEVFNVSASDFPALFPQGFPQGEIGFFGNSQRDARYSLVSPLHSVCSAICGDGVVLGDETCDDEISGGDCHDTTCRYVVDATHLNSTELTPANAPYHSATPLPVIRGTGDKDATIHLTVGGTTYTTTVASDKSWSVPLTVPLTPGAYTANITQTDVRGGQSTDSVPFTYVEHFVKITSPVGPPTPVIGGPAYSGSIPVTGTGIAGTSVTVTATLGSTSASNSTTVAADGTWSTTIPFTVNGVIALHAVSVNSYSMSAEDTSAVGLDTQTFVTITSPANGVPRTTGVLTITGTGEVGGTVTVAVGTATSAPVVVGAGGTWSVPAPGAPLEDGSFTVVASILDALSNPASATSSFGVSACDSDAVTDCGPNATCEDVPHSDNYHCQCHPGYVPAVGGGCVAGPQVTIITPADGALLLTNTPTFTGTANPNKMVALTLDGVPLGTVPSNASGAWTYVTPEGSPIDNGGPYTLVATITIEGVSATDTATFSINSDVCNTPSLNDCDENSDCVDHGDGNYECVCHSGYVKDDAEVCVLAPYVTIDSPADGVTIRTTTPTLRGTANPNATVRLQVDHGDVGSTTADAAGNWTFVLPEAHALAGDGDYLFTAINQIGASIATDEITVYLLSEANTVIIESPVEGETTSTQPHVVGSANPNATLTLAVDGVELGTTLVDENGRWTWDVPSPLPFGPANIKATDKANGAWDDVNILIVRALAPVVITQPHEGAVGKNPTPIIVGTAEPFAIVTIIIDGEELGTTNVNEDGEWNFPTTEPLSDGGHTVVARDNHGSEDTAHFTIESAVRNPPTPEATMSGGFLYGCSSSPAPSAGIVILLLGVAVTLRRRSRKAA